MQGPSDGGEPAVEFRNSRLIQRLLGTVESGDAQRAARAFCWSDRLRNRTTSKICQAGCDGPFYGAGLGIDIWNLLKGEIACGRSSQKRKRVVKAGTFDKEGGRRGTDGAPPERPKSERNLCAVDSSDTAMATGPRTAPRRRSTCAGERFVVAPRREARPRRLGRGGVFISF